jgi:eukaryotic-like serine/threonine-protein kinase
MQQAAPSVEELFFAALEIEGSEARSAFLDRHCGDTELRRRVEELLAGDAQGSGFLEAPASVLTVTAAHDSRLSVEEPGTIIGPYKLLEAIGEGGMGTVYMAEQTQPVRRKVALKIIKPGMDTKQVVARFEAERQALALMDHPNIAKVHDAGAADSGRPYFVMELVKGVPITRYCDETRLTPRERLELFLPVCQAIQHAHQKGIIHRDLKPSNILVGLYDRQPVPKVIDFGVAKAAGPKLTEATLFTGFGMVIGTPEYMSPEHAQLDNLDIDTRSDIYSLGVLLYELLTGTTPFTTKDLEMSGLLETLRMIREQEPPKPSTKLSTAESLPALAANRGTEPAKLRKLVRGELDWIVMQCLEKDRNRRYETASSLAADVQRYLHDEPVRACPPSTWYRFRKFARRNRRAVATAAAAALVVVLAVAGLATSTLLIALEQQETQRARDALRHDTYFHRIALAHRELFVDNLGRALRFLRECPEDLRGWEWNYLMRLCRVEPLVLRDKNEVNSLAFSLDGEFLASAVGDGAVKVWNSRTGKLIRTLKNAHPDSVYSVAFHRDGRHLASAGADQKVKVWDWTTGRNVWTCPSPSDADHNRGTGYVVVFSPDGRRLAAGSDGAVNVWDWQKEQLLLTLPGHARKGISVAFSPDGRRLASGSWSGDVMIWDAETGQLLHTLSEHRASVSALAFSPDGRRLVSASFDRSLIVWDATTGQRLRHIEGHVGLVLGVAFSSPDGSRLASAGEDKTVRVWEAETSREVLDLRGHTEWSLGVAVSLDGPRLASAGGDGRVRVWDATPLWGDEGQEAFTLSQEAGEVWTVAVDPDGRRLASAGLGANTPVKVWDVSSRRVTFEFRGHVGGAVFCVAWHPDGHRIASSGWDAEQKLFVVKVWDARTGEPGPPLPAGTETYAVAFSPDGVHLVTGSANGSVQVWDARDGQPVGKVGQHGRPVRGLVFSRDGRQLASASGDGVVKVWDWDPTRLGDEQEPRRTFRARVPLAGMTFAFSPDGRRLVAGGVEKTVKIWDVRTGQELQTLQGHSGDVWATAFSPDDEGRWVASAGEDTTVKVWDTRNGELVHSFRGHIGLVSTVAFSHDGRLLFSGSRDKTVKCWDLTQLDQGPGRE